MKVPQYDSFVADNKVCQEIKKSQIRKSISFEEEKSKIEKIASLRPIGFSKKRMAQTKEKV